MLKYLLTFEERDRPRTFSPTRTVKTNGLIIHLTGQDFGIDNYFEGLVPENAVYQQIASKGRGGERVPSSFDRLCTYLSEFDGFASGVVFREHVLVFRDFVGLIPVFMGGMPTAVTNCKLEAKVRGCDVVQPGTVTEVPSNRRQTYFEPHIFESDSDMLLQSLVESVDKYCPKKVAVFFSGGLDSVLLTKILLDRGVSPVLLTIGTEDSHDFQAAEKAAKILGLSVEHIVVSSELVRQALHQLQNVLGQLEPMDAAIGVAMTILSRAVAEKELFAAVLGQGADELFGGYMKYERTLIETGYRGVEQALLTDFARLGTEGLVRDFTAIRLGGAYPLPLFLTRRVVEVALNLPVSMKIAKINGEISRKHVLRIICKKLGLSELADVRKKALQYGSGLEKMVRKLL